MPYSDDNMLLLEMTNEQLVILSEGSTHINTDRTTQARLVADTLIDSFLYSIYQVPFAEPVNTLIKMISNDLTLANLHEYKSKNTLIPVMILERKQSAMKLLMMLKNREIALPASSIFQNLIITNKSDFDSIFIKDYYE